MHFFAGWIRLCGAKGHGSTELCCVDGAEYENEIVVSWIFFAQMTHATTQWALARRLAQTEQVVLIGLPVSILRERRVASFEARAQHSEDSKRLWNYSPLHLPERIPGFRGLLHEINRHRLYLELNRILTPEERRIACYDQPAQHDMVKKLGEEISVYLALDDRTLTVWGKSIPRELEAEKRLLAEVDIVVCVSNVLAEMVEARLPQGRKIPIHVLTNGFDENVFDPQRQWVEPAILKDIPRPRILVTGYVSERIDWEGVIGCVEVQPDWTWIFIGPTSRGIQGKITDLSASLGLSRKASHLPPLLWRDAVPVEEVPALIAHCDACAVPYRLNAFTRASSPLKAIEYLAMGAPVISTRIPALLRYGDAIQWVEEGDGESYARGLDQLSSNLHNLLTRERRRAVVASDTWAHKTDQFREIVHGSKSIMPPSYRGAML